METETLVFILSMLKKLTNLIKSIRDCDPAFQSHGRFVGDPNSSIILCL